MEQINLKELFRFIYANNMYPDGLSRILTMEPTEECQKTLKSYKLHFKRKEGGFMIVAPVTENAGEYELIHPFKNDAVLSFAIFNHDPQFFEKSDLPFDTPGEYVYYFNNCDETSRRTTLLSGGSPIKETERVPLRTKKFSFPLNEGVAPHVYDCNGNEIPADEYNQETDVVKNQFIIDISRLRDGFYTIEYDSQSITCYCARESFIRRIPLAVIELFTTPEVPENYQIVQTIDNKQCLSQKNFTLQSGTSVYYWRYKIIPDIPSSTWLKVLTTESGITFDPPRIRINSDDPVFFTSESEIDLNTLNFQVFLYRSLWSDDCWWHGSHKYKYCDHNYGIYINGEFRCRYSTAPGVHPHSCSASSTDHLIGELPKPNEVATEFYSENGKEIAEITMYVYKNNGNWVLSQTPQN